MSIGLILGAVVVFIILLRLLSNRFHIVRTCAEEHRVGPIFLKHHAKVPCDLALQVARYAQALWEELRGDFPKETSEGFVLSVIHDPHCGLGWKLFNQSAVVINLAVPPPLGSKQMSFELRERILRGTIAEELHHIVRVRQFGEEPYLFKAYLKDRHLRTVLYYAFNKFEYEALRFSVRTTGYRADLLVEVEEYRRMGERGT